VDFLERGSIVLWESGAAFLRPSEFATQQDLARNYFGISIGRPLDVWSKVRKRKSIASEKNRSARGMRALGHQQVPYVSYHWPRETPVRDFSRVIPVSARSGHAIAHWREIPVAWRKTIGAGTLVFVGSPIGPALHAKDSDSASLLRALISA